MSTDLRYRILFVRNAAISVRFFVDQLGYKLFHHIILGGKVCPLLENSSKELIGLIEESDKDDCINILNTDDCLRDYCMFKQREVQALGKPQYQAEGLAVAFNDPSGTRFILLEKRDYTNV